jgi:hypothetical protein
MTFAGSFSVVARAFAVPCPRRARSAIFAFAAASIFRLALAVRGPLRPIDSKLSP